jgi:CDP-diacylglycerol--glycerol-3-phosphate 3-phosphatidyltransferase
MPQSIKLILPNLLTLSRGILVIIIALLFYTDLPYKYLIILASFSLAALSDMLDGMLARRWKVKSTFGVVFDSLFDKILTIVMYLLLIPFSILHPAVYVALVIRDIFIDGIKNYSLSLNKPIPSRVSGKIKMVAQISMIALAILVLIFPGNSLIKSLLYISAGTALSFSYYSAIIYLSDWLPIIRKK